MILLAGVLASCATKDREALQEVEVIPEIDPPATIAETDPDADSEEDFFESTQSFVHGVVNGAAQSVDSFFGRDEIDEDVEVTRGLVAPALLWDEREGTEVSGKFRAKVRLPAFEHRMKLLVGRDNVDDLTDGRSDDHGSRLPDRFHEFRDESWLLGVGFLRDRPNEGWDFDAGVKVSSPLEPYSRITYRFRFTNGDSWLWRMRPRVFWQDTRGAGVSLANTVDVAVGENTLLRSYSFAVKDEETRGVSWTQEFISFYRLNKRTALSYSVFANGETEAEVQLVDVGVETTVRRRLDRRWLFLEVTGYVNWSRKHEAERRDANPGVQIRLELQFGEWPGRQD